MQVGVHFQVKLRQMNRQTAWSEGGSKLLTPGTLHFWCNLIGCHVKVPLERGPINLHQKYRYYQRYLLAKFRHIVSVYKLCRY